MLTTEERRQYRQAHREEIAAYMKGWRERNQAHVSEYERRYKASRSAAQRFAWESNKRAKRRGCMDRLVASLLPAGPCAYCGRAEEPIGWDHVVPLSRGGGNLPDNIVRCCKPCNDHKRDRTPEEWLDVERAEAKRAKKRAYIRQWHRDHAAELYAKAKAKRALVGHW